MGGAAHGVDVERYFCQSLLSYQCELAGLDPGSAVLDKQSPGQLGCTPMHGEFLDNFVVLGTVPATVNHAAQSIRKQLCSIGFIVHETETAVLIGERLGLCFDGTQNCVRLAHRKLWRLLLVIINVLNMPRVHYSVVEKLLGHFTYAFTLRREAPSTFTSVYAFVQRGRDGHRASHELWNFARRELWFASSILPLVSSSLSLPWSSVVLASDSSATGYCVWHWSD